MSRDPTVARLIAVLGLEPLSGEGGFFRQTSRSSTASAIFFLLTRDDFSALHQLVQDEIWHFYAGDVVSHVQLNPRDGAMHLVRMGSDVLAGQHPQVHVPPGVWQGARLQRDQPPDISDLVPDEGKSAPTTGTAPRSTLGFALLGCTVSPPWEERGFTLGVRDDLMRTFPAHTPWIKALTR